MTSQGLTERRPWLMYAGLAAGIGLGFAAARWLPGRRRRSNIEYLQDKATELTHRVGDIASDVGDRASDTATTVGKKAQSAVDDLKDRF